MTVFVAELTTAVKARRYQLGKRPTGGCVAILADMATKPRGRARQLQTSAWFDHLGVNDAEVAEKIGVLRETVWRWRREPWRLDPDKIEDIATALTALAREKGMLSADSKITAPQLWYPPTRESIDAMLDGADEDTRKMAADIVRRMVRK